MFSANAENPSRVKAEFKHRHTGKVFITMVKGNPLDF
jgi:hypothetical protein